MLLKFIRICFLLIVIGGSILIYNNPEMRSKILYVISPAAKNLPEVKGINTKRAENITNDIKSDFFESITQVQENILNMKISDVVDLVDGSKKITSDFRNFQEYIKEEANNYVKEKIKR